MRDIKFRVWDSEEKKWLTDVKVEFIHSIKSWGEEFYLEIAEDWTTPSYNPIRYIFVQPTGLKANKRLANGDVVVNADIYEGDILEVRDMGFGYKYVGVINWHQEQLGYVLGISKDYPTMHAGKRDIMHTLKYHSFEIIGNIYENEELLK